MFFAAAWSTLASFGLEGRVDAKVRFSCPQEGLDVKWSRMSQGFSVSLYPHTQWFSMALMPLTACLSFFQILTKFPHVWGRTAGAVCMKHRGKMLLLHPFCLTSSSAGCHSLSLPAGPWRSFSLIQTVPGVHQCPFVLLPREACSFTVDTRSTRVTVLILSNLLFLLSSRDPAVFAAVSSERVSEYKASALDFCPGLCKNGYAGQPGKIRLLSGWRVPWCLSLKGLIISHLRDGDRFVLSSLSSVSSFFFFLRLRQL